MSNRFRVREVLAVVIIIAMVAAVVLPAILAAREAGRRLACQNNLKQLSLGVLNYSDAFRAFPMGTCGGRDLRPAERFSWYLPLWNFIEGKPPRLLLDTTQAWNAEVNRWPKLEYTIDWNEPTERKEIRPLNAVRMFGCPTAEHREIVLGISVTEYVGMAGLGLKSPEVDLGQAGCGAWGFDRQITNADVIDGLGSTISLIETNRDPGPWLAGGPPTVRGIETGESPYIGRGMQFGGLHPGGCQTAMLDGSVRFIENEIDCNAFSAMVTIAGQD